MSHLYESHRVYAQFMDLPMPARIVQVEYIWLTNDGIRSKCQSVKLKDDQIRIESPEQLPKIEVQSSKIDKIDTKESDVVLGPVAIYPDPFRRGNNIIALCDYLDANTLEPLPSSTRGQAKVVFDSPKVKSEVPWFGIEQEYVLFEGSPKNQPLNWPKNGQPPTSVSYYCGVGTLQSFGRRVIETHYRMCLYAGLSISGINSEEMASQWEYQIGPCEGISAADQMIVSRYILYRVCEDFGINASLHPKPCGPQWCGSGGHVNFSTSVMRKDGGFKYILTAVDKLSKNHMDHMKVYGDDNQLRLTGKDDIPAYTSFSSGIADRGSSIRIPLQVNVEQKGYFEDRRPAANMDPYLVTARLCRTLFLES